MSAIDDRWAWNQIEAMADGALRGRDRQRMTAAMARDPQLWRAVRDARKIRKALRRAGRSAPAMPAGLRRRLWALGAVPPPRQISPLWSWGSASAAAAIVAATMFLVAQPRPAEQQRLAALHDFEIAMTYLERSSAVVSGEVTRSVGAGLREALETSRRSALGEKPHEHDGG